MTKLTGNPAHFKAGIRASVVLFPIFGIHFIWYAFYIIQSESLDSCTTASFVWKYIQIGMEGLQGCIVTILFLFLNPEVKLK